MSQLRPRSGQGLQDMLRDSGRADTATARGDAMHHALSDFKMQTVLPLDGQAAAYEAFVFAWRKQQARIDELEALHKHEEHLLMLGSAKIDELIREKASLQQHTRDLSHALTLAQLAASEL